MAAHLIRCLLGCLCLSGLISGLSPSARADISVMDDSGSRLTLAAPAKRVVVLAPHLVELMFSIGQGESVVGTVSYSNFPEDARAIPRVGSHQQYSLEAIARLQPDLVVGWLSGNGLARLNPIKALGIPVMVTDARSLQDVSRLMRLLGTVTASPAAGPAADEFDATLQYLHETYASRLPISVFYQVWNEPLRTITDDHLIGDVIRLCGGVNSFGDFDSLAPVIGVESVLRENPQVIVASGMAEERPEWLDDWRQWPSLQAVEHEQLKFVPPDLLQRHTPRILMGAKMMCDHLQAAREFYYQ